MFCFLQGPLFPGWSPEVRGQKGPSPKSASPVPKTQTDQPHSILLVFRREIPFGASLHKNEHIYLKDGMWHFYTIQEIWILFKVEFIIRSQINKPDLQIFQKSEGQRQRINMVDIWGISAYSNLSFFSLRTISFTLERSPLAASIMPWIYLNIYHR